MSSNTPVHYSGYASHAQVSSGAEASQGPSSGDAGYIINSRGTNSQGNHYDTRTDAGGPAYPYSNSDGSYYYKNSDGSQYYNAGPEKGGGSTYTTPNGHQVKK